MNMKEKVSKIKGLIRHHEIECMIAYGEGRDHDADWHQKAADNYVEELADVEYPALAFDDVAYDWD